MRLCFHRVWGKLDICMLSRLKRAACKAAASSPYCTRDGRVDDAALASVSFRYSFVLVPTASFEKRLFLAFKVFRYSKV